MYSKLYGSGVPMSMTIERNILGATPRRATGMKSSLLGLEVARNTLHRIDYEDFLNTEVPRISKTNAHERFLKQFDWFNKKK